LNQAELFDWIEHAKMGWVSYRLPAVDGISIPAPRHFIEPEAQSNQPWRDDSRNGFVVAPFHHSAGPELWMNPVIEWQGQHPDTQTMQAVEEWLYPLEKQRESEIHTRFSRPSTYPDFCESVEQIKAILQPHDREGTIETSTNTKPFHKIVWSRTKDVSLHPEAHPCLFFEALCLAYPGSHIVLLQHPEYGTWVGCSPETLVEKNGDNVRSMALAGTRIPGNRDPWGHKEIREQRMVLEYLEDCFASKNIQSTSNQTTTINTGPVEHLVNQIEGISSVSCFEMAHVLHPTPAVAGFPVKESVDYILANEPHLRSLYSGYWGYIDEKGDGLISVNLRCLQWQKNHVTLYMGAGILADSIAEDEWLETSRKSKTLLNIIEQLNWISSPVEIQDH
jgi:isochorismate synthase EntC